MEEHSKHFDCDNPLPLAHVNYTDPSKQKSYFVTRLSEEKEKHSTDERRSADLMPLTKTYQDFRRRLKGLVKSTRSYQKMARQLEKARSKCFEDCISLFGGNYQDNQGAFPESAAGEPEVPKGKQNPIAALHKLANVQEMVHAGEFQQNVLDYAIEWEKGVTATIDMELQEVRKLQQHRLHYERNVHSLRRRVVALESKEKDIPSSLTDKLRRNENKLQSAWEGHEERASTLCLLIEQITDYGWKDLYPYIENLLKYEFNRSGRENLIYGQFSSALRAMKAFHR